jgi:2,4-dienoyl-CoA reductase-like NADH-dependent reductase (Old Yellow Enzyme family)
MIGSSVVFGEETAVGPVDARHHCAASITMPHPGLPTHYRFLGRSDRTPFSSATAAASIAHGPLKGRAALTEADAREGLRPWQGLAPSALPASPGGAIPRAMGLDDIRENIAAWREATQRSVDAGYDICEIHGAHGYLIHQFLSPVSNKRTDGYGDGLAGRMRFALEVVDAVRTVWPKDRPLFFRTSAVEGAGGEWGIEDTLALTRELKAHGVDVVDCSSGGIMGEGAMPAIPRVPGYQVGYSREIRREVGIPTMAVGMITEPSHAEAILREGHADLIALARELMDNPNWPLHAARALGYGDPFDLVHAREAQRLRLREQHRNEYPTGIEVDIPFGPSEQVPYSWPARTAGPRERH